MFARRLLLSSKYYLCLRQLVENRNLHYNSFVRSSYLTWNLNNTKNQKSNQLRQCHQKVKTTEEVAEFVDETDLNVVENKEHKAYHDKMLSLPGYAEILVDRPDEKQIQEEVAQKLLQENWKQMEISDVVSNFEIIASYVNTCLKQDQTVNYEPILLVISERFAYMSHSQLEAIIKQFQLLRSQNKKRHQQFIKALDNEIKNRMFEFNFEQRLQMCDLLHMAAMSRVTYCFWKMMKMLSSKVHAMSQHQLVHYTYLLLSNKQCNQHMYELEYHLEKYIQFLTLNELSLIALCFFKRKYQPRHQNFSSILLQRVVDSMDEIDTIQVSSIMKFCRSFRNKEQMDQFQKLLEALEEKLDKFDLPVMPHIAQAAANSVCYNKSLMDKVVDKFTSNISQFRIKDIERMAFALNIMNYDPKHPAFKNIDQEINDTVKRQQEFKKYSKSVPISCMFLGEAGYYNLKTLDKIMHPNFYNPIYDSEVHRMTLEYLWLDQSIEIEVPEFKGQRLDETICEKLIKFYKTRIPAPDKGKNKYENFVLNVADECKKLYQEKSTTICQILPHYSKPDIIIAMDRFNKIIPVKEVMSERNGIKYIPEEFKADHKWFALMIGTQYSCFYGTDQPSGFTTSKMRQLQKLGYIPILINMDVWPTLAHKKSKYLESLLMDDGKKVSFEKELFIE